MYIAEKQSQTGYPWLGHGPDAAHLDPKNVSIVVPARNEATVLPALLEKLRASFKGSEIIVVDDGSSDDTREVCRQSGARVVSHPYGVGNGGAIKTGARAAGREVLVFLDADGQHDPADIDRLFSKLLEGYDMVVGARAPTSHASFGRRLANSFYNWMASALTGHLVQDLTSGFRIARAEKFREFIHLLPNGFSYPTTITMCFFRAGYPVGYVPITAGARQGKSHIRPLQDGLRFLLIIFRVGTLYSPLKVFVPISLLFFILGSGYYGYTLLTLHRFTNMSALLLTTSVLIFLIGLVSEQITNLLYSQKRS
ncbi:MAG: glycosyltransferase family 2 protein [Gammaproteobacteria bacterium]|nr:glycosyltransferase family 2 protein [Gammaproteobacteria bacterium]NIR84252.1 glycosyltransferase family 2 protein [Gammaproteobacteria bacterium]NIR89722.1 glycosyltransferase family 2 protein [Gammaproteobacteria bacterium]NIU05410.1 glycosyltransferase family 2 protein [Gammaproteobacteria bacterium]NIV52356.1 glycosyltransferase [Gammaproteobacteria bacterium]